MDQVLELVGPIGKYQKLMILLIGSLSALTAYTFFATVFINATPNLTCVNKSKNNEIVSADETCIAWNNFTASSSSSSPFHCSFDTTYFGRTVITEWSLVCDRVYLTGIGDTIYMIGSFLSLFVGFFSDRYGRRRVCLACTVALTVSLLLSSILLLEQLNLSAQAQFITYASSRLLAGIFTNALFCIAYVLLVELSTKRYSTLVSNANLMAFVGGELIVLLVAWLARDWRIILWFITAWTALASCLLFFCLPESPAYLVEHGRLGEAAALLKRIARLNGATQPPFSTMQNDRPEADHLIRKQAAAAKNKVEDEFFLDKLNQLPKRIGNKTDKKQLDSSSTNGNSTGVGVLRFIFGSIRNLLNVIFLSFIWFDLALVYYGISLGVASVDDLNSPYLIYALSSISELIGYSTFWLNDRLGRNRMFAIYMLGACISCGLVAFVKARSHKIENLTISSITTTSTIVFVSLGKVMISAAYSSAYSYTASFFPTRIRTTMLLFVNSVGRFGSMLSPQVNLLGNLVWPPLSYLVFSASALLSFILVLIFPYLNQAMATAK